MKAIPPNIEFMLTGSEFWDFSRIETNKIIILVTIANMPATMYTASGILPC